MFLRNGVTIYPPSFYVLFYFEQCILPLNNVFYFKQCILPRYMAYCDTRLIFFSRSSYDHTELISACRNFFPPGPLAPSPLKKSNSSFIVQFWLNLKHNLFIRSPIIIEIKIYKWGPLAKKKTKGRTKKNDWCKKASSDQSGGSSLQIWPLMKKISFLGAQNAPWMFPKYGYADGLRCISVAKLHIRSKARLRCISVAKPGYADSLPNAQVPSRC